jgi:hypothetical protein
MFHTKCYLYYGSNNEAHEEDRVVCLDIRMSTNVGNNQMKICENSNFDISKLEPKVPCAY